MSDNQTLEPEEETGTPLGTVDVLAIMEMVPHRYPFLLIDRVENIVKGVSATGVKNVTINEPHFQGHFPRQPVMPGVLIVEAMAQTAAVLVVHTLGEDARGRLVYFMSIDGARFRRPVTPGDQLKLEMTVLQNRRNVWKIAGKALVDGKVVAEGSVAAMLMDEKIN